MPFNVTDYTEAPFTQESMHLTHDECIKVRAKTDKIIEDFVPDRFFEVANGFYVVPIYNDANQTELINGQTYDLLVQYDFEINTQGINKYGIIPEPVEEVEPELEEEATEETEVEPETNEEATETDEEVTEEKEEAATDNQTEQDLADIGIVAN